MLSRPDARREAPSGNWSAMRAHVSRPAGSSPGWGSETTRANSGIRRSPGPCRGPSVAGEGLTAPPEGGVRPPPRRWPTRSHSANAACSTCLVRSAVRVLSRIHHQGRATLHRLRQRVVAAVADDDVRRRVEGAARQGARPPPGPVRRRAAMPPGPAPESAPSARTRCRSGPSGTPASAGDTARPSHGRRSPIPRSRRPSDHQVRNRAAGVCLRSRPARRAGRRTRDTGTSQSRAGEAQFLVADGGPPIARDQERVVQSPERFQPEDRRRRYLHAPGTENRPEHVDLQGPRPLE